VLFFYLPRVFFDNKVCECEPCRFVFHERAAGPCSTIHIHTTNSPVTGSPHCGLAWGLRSLFFSTAIIADMHRLGGTSSSHMYALLFHSQHFGQHVYLALARCDRRRSCFKERLCVVSLLHLRFSLAPEYEFHNAQAGTIYRVVAVRAHDFTPARTGPVSFPLPTRHGWPT
jgi:hypothetical protein